MFPCECVNVRLKVLRFFLIRVNDTCSKKAQKE